MLEVPEGLSRRKLNAPSADLDSGGDLLMHRKHFALTRVPWQRGRRGRPIRWQSPAELSARLNHRVEMRGIGPG